MDENTNLKRPPIEGTSARHGAADKVSASAGTRSRDRCIAPIHPACVCLLCCTTAKRIEQAMILRRRLDVQQIEQPNSRLRCRAWIGQSNGRSLPRCQADDGFASGRQRLRRRLVPTSSFRTSPPNAASVSSACAVSQHLCRRRRSALPRFPGADHAGLPVAPWPRPGSAGSGAASSRSAHRGSACVAWRMSASNRCAASRLRDVQHVADFQRRGLGRRTGGVWCGRRPRGAARDRIRPMKPVQTVRSSSLTVWVSRALASA